MVYNVKIKKQVAKFLSKQQKHIQKRFNNWLDKLCENTYEANDGIVINYSIGDKQVYKKRIGEVRILFVVFENTVTVVLVKAQNRGQVYK